MAEEIKKEEIKDVEFFAKAGIGGAQITKNKSITAKTPAKTTRSNVRNLMRKPFTNRRQLQDIEEFLYANSGQYFRIIDYLVNLLTYDHYIYPSSNIESDIKNRKKNMFGSAKYLDSLNVKYNSANWARTLLRKGEAYIYKIDDKPVATYMTIPAAYCRIVGYKGNVFSYEIDLKAFTDDTIKNYPEEFQKEYKRRGFQGKRSRSVNKEYGWYLVGERGFAFNFYGTLEHGFPVFAFMFDELMKLEEVKDKEEQVNNVENFKIIHQFAKIDEKTGEPVIPYAQMQIAHEALKKNVPDGAAVNTNTLEMKVHDLSSAVEKKQMFSQIVEQGIWSASGISATLFGSDINSGEAQKRSELVDAMFMYPFLELFKGYFDTELTSRKTQIKFVKVSNVDQAEKEKLAREDMISGGSRMEWAAFKGQTPWEFFSAAYFEKDMGIDDILVPKATGHTASQDAGAPQLQDVGGAGEKSRDAK